jgi:hypothetical protein
MIAGTSWPLNEIPRQRLEEMVVHALGEVRNLRRREQSHTYFQAIAAGFVLGAMVATAGFAFGASIG